MKVLVTGATGRSGGAAARALLAWGAQVRFLTRSPQGEKARLLAEAGAEPAEGDLLRPAGVRVALEGMDAAYLVSAPFPGLDEELEQGRAFVEAARDSGLRHLVFQSVLYADTTVTHCATKGRIEGFIREAGLPFTVLRPAIFLDILMPYLTDPRPGVLQPLRPSIPVYWIAVEDIGWAAASVLAEEKPEGNRYDVAYPEPASLDRLAEIFREASGCALDFDHVEVPWRNRPAPAWLRGPEDSGEDYYRPMQAQETLCDPGPLMRRFGLRFKSPEEYVRGFGGRQTP